MGRLRWTRTKSEALPNGLYPKESSKYKLFWDSATSIVASSRISPKKHDRLQTSPRRTCPGLGEHASKTRSKDSSTRLSQHPSWSCEFREAVHPRNRCFRIRYWRSTLAV